MTVDIREFLEARLADDETGRSPHWSICHTNIPVFGHNMPCNCDMPARWRREVEAKRRLLAFAQVLDDDRYPSAGYVLQLLALPYADHPDFDPSWSPESVTGDS